MARNTPGSRPFASCRAQRPVLAAEANRSNHRIDELEAELAWQIHVDAGLLPVR